MHIDHTPLALLKSDATKIFVSVDDHLGRLRREIDELNSAEAKAKYSPQYIQGQLAHKMRKAKADAVERSPDVDAIAARIEVARKAWATESLMRRATLTPHGADVNERILAELVYMRTLTDMERASPGEVIEMAGAAAKEGNLARLEMLRKESTRREYSDGTERMQVQTAIRQAISDVDIPQQKQALAMLAEAQLSVEAAQDTLAEIAGGKETERAKMRRVMAEQSVRKEAA